MFYYFEHNSFISFNKQEILTPLYNYHVLRLLDNSCLFFLPHGLQNHFIKF